MIGKYSPRLGALVLRAGVDLPLPGRCVTAVNILMPSRIVVSGGTDGRLAFWKLPDAIEHYCDDTFPEILTIQPAAAVEGCHQSSINAIAFTAFSGD